MAKHIRELKDMRRVAREENISAAALAEYLKVPERDIFNIMVGTTKEGDLRTRVYELLASSEIAAGWNKPLIAAKETADEPTPEQETTENFTDEERFAPVDDDKASEQKRMQDAWKASGLSQGQIGKLFNRTASSVGMILSGYVVKGALYDALRGYLLEGKEPVRFETWGNKGKTKPAEQPMPLDPVAPAAHVAIPQAAVAKAAPPVVVCMVQNADPDEVLRAQIMALEELTEATKDLLVAREAERRYSAAVAIARRVGLAVNAHERKTAAA